MLMRPSPAARSGRMRPLVLLLTAGALLSCRDGGVTGNAGVRQLVVTAPSTELRPGFIMVATAQAIGADGEVLEGREITWRSRTPATLAVAEDGLLLALAPGIGIARASIGSVSAELRLDLVNPPIASLTLDVDTLRLSLPGGAHTLVPMARDAEGVEIRAPALSWESGAARIAAVTSSGVVNAVAVGSTIVLVRGDDLVTAVQVVVDAPPTATSPLIGAVTPSLLVPGQQVVVTGSRFAATPAGNTVLVDGTAVAVTSASATQLVLTLPPEAAFACEPTRTVALQIGNGGGIGVAMVSLQVATEWTLAPGQSVVLTTAASARCNSLTPAAGRYLITLPNAARTLGAATMALTVRGVATAAGGAALVAPDAATGANLAAIRGATEREAAARRRPAPDRRRLETHLRILEANRDLLASRRPTAPEGARLQAAVQAPALGNVLPVRIPNVGQPDFCDAYTAINARAVFVGPRVVLLEDTVSSFGGQSTLAGQMDSDYAAIGAELESVVWPVIQSFGNPLVMDSRLDDNGRVAIVFSPRMNQKQGGSILAAVVSCDFFSRAQFASSNVGEYVYAQVPTSSATGFGPGTRAAWRHEIRGTLAHELKHVTSFAERIIRGQPLEERWLEEATGRHAEELYARSVLGTTRNGNAGFAAALECEIRAGDPAFPACADTPRAMQPAFEALWDYLDAPATHSPLGAILPADVSFYGSGWALTRWLIDQEGLAEPAFFTALTTSGQAGIANLEGRTGRQWDEILPEWTLAMASDDRPGFTPSSTRLRFPSWDLRSVFQGFCDVLGSCVDPLGSATYPRAFPLQPVALSAGPFSVEMPAIVPGGFAVIELDGGAGGLAQLIELKGFRGAVLPATVRLGIVRIG